MRLALPESLMHLHNQVNTLFQPQFLVCTWSGCPKRQSASQGYTPYVGGSGMPLEGCCHFT